MQKFNFLLKYEKYLFLLFVLLFLIPVVGNKYFLTIDGPAHLHNANLLKQLLFYGKTDLLNFYDVNTRLNSNLFNHIWFAAFGIFLPPFLVEKSILLFYIFSLPYSFRFLLKNSVETSTNTKLSSYLIFPFIYSFPFRMGFFNFCLGIPILFWCLGFWLNNRKNYSASKMALLFILTILLYFSHLFNFLIFVLIILINEAVEFAKTKNKKILILQIKRSLIVLFPSIILLIIFIFSNNEYTHNEPTFLPKNQLLNELLELRPLITLHHDNEKPFTQIYFYMICFLFLFSAYKSIKDKLKNNIVWFVSAMIVLLIYFLFPDWIESGGFISVRWLLFFYLLIIMWIGVQQLSWKFTLIPIITILITSLFFINYHYKITIPLSADVEELVDAGKQIEEGKVLLPLNYSFHWMYINASNYIGAEKEIIVLDNYEPTKPHFPLLWKKGESVYDIMPNYGDKIPPCINIKNYEQKTKHRIDYISEWCFSGTVSDSCSKVTEDILVNQFDLIYSSPSKKLKLFKRKNNHELPY